MIFIFLIPIFYFAYNILKKRSNTYWYLAALLLFMSSIVIIPKPNLPTSRLFVLAFIVSLFAYNKEQSWKSFCGFPLFKCLIVYFFCILIVGWHSQNLTIFYKIYKPLLLFIEGYFVLYLGYTSIKAEKFVIPTAFKKMLFAYLIYDIFCASIHTNPFLEFESFVCNANANLYFLESARGARYSALWYHPISYSMICIALQALVFLASNLKNKEKTYLSVLLAINVFLCNTRTGLLCYIIFMFIYWLLNVNFSKKIKIIFMGLVVGVLSVAFIPSVQNKFSSVVDIFTTGGQNTEGSSIDMRESQYNACFLLFAENPIYGNGIDFIHDVMYNGNDEINPSSPYYSPDYYGFESYLYILMIEQGLLGIISNIFILVSLVLFFFYSYKIDKQKAVVYLALTVSWIIFIFSTGVLGTSIVVLFILGMIMKSIKNKKLQWKSLL